MALHSQHNIGRALLSADNLHNIRIMRTFSIFFFKFSLVLILCCFFFVYVHRQIVIWIIISILLLLASFEGSSLRPSRFVTDAPFYVHAWWESNEGDEVSHFLARISTICVGTRVVIWHCCWSSKSVFNPLRFNCISVLLLLDREFLDFIQTSLWERRQPGWQTCTTSTLFLRTHSGWIFVFCRYIQKRAREVPVCQRKHIFHATLGRAQVYELLDMSCERCLQKKTHLHCEMDRITEASYITNNFQSYSISALRCLRDSHSWSYFCLFRYYGIVEMEKFILSPRLFLDSLWGEGAKKFDASRFD